MSADSTMPVRSSYQKTDGGSIPTSALQFWRTGLSSVSGFVKQFHYSRTHPGGVDYCFAAMFEGRIVGACMFGYMAGNPRAMVVCEGADSHRQYRELMRLVLLDEVMKNAESKFIGYCLRWLKKNTELVAIISFADPKYGHRGGIYQATNWLYAGLQKPDRDRIILQRTDLFGDYEKEMHPRQAIDIYGSSSKGAVGKSRFTVREPKHRYIYLLREGLKCKYQPLAYPK